MKTVLNLGTKCDILLNLFWPDLRPHRYKDWFWQYLNLYITKTKLENELQIKRKPRDLIGQIETLT